MAAVHSEPPSAAAEPMEVGGPPLPQASTAGSSDAGVAVVDPFHGRLVQSQPTASSRPRRPQAGTKRRKRRKLLSRAQATGEHAGGEANGQHGRSTARGCEDGALSTAASGAAPVAASVAAVTVVGGAAPASATAAAGGDAAAPGGDLRDADATAGASRGADHEGGVSSRPKGRRGVFEYGNYDAYYGYRYAGGGVAGACGDVLDPRLAAMDASWFRGKRCLDIGCNAGQLTMAIARTFGVESMVGVDIDAALVRRARGLIRSAAPVVSPIGTPPVRTAPTEAGGDERARSGGLSNDDFRKLLLGGGGYPISHGACYGGHQAAPQAAPQAASQHPSSPAQHADAPMLSATPRHEVRPPPPAFPHSVRFEHCNFVQDPPAPDQPGVGAAGAQYDTVSCFSTSKWVHLNFGDEGVVRLFQRVHACLRPGGRFLLEPQPWSSYRKRANLTPTISSHYRQIRMRPTDFVDFLLSEAVGFVSAERVEVPYAHGAANGFKRRPLVVFRKGLSASA